MNATMLPMAKRRSVNSERFISGSVPSSFFRRRLSVRRCNHTNSSRASAAPPSRAALAAVPPCSSTRPLSRHSVPTEASSRPRQSSPEPCGLAAPPPGAVPGTKRCASQSEAMQNGTTMKKIDRQPKPSTSRPPMLGPMAGASTTPMPKMPLARPCSCGSKARRMMMAGMGCTTPAARPSATRAASTSGK